ncbi:hypothetical protein [Variovorax rhizosphaerae]|uniref:Uncharacterized protein n=1 Tax=Variovorax rhizosphaerae TaxID=1836200 RepID=A0ABU8WYM5_9BURK
MKGKRYTCPKCTDFFIDSSSEDYLLGLPEVTRTAFRAGLSKHAQVVKPGYLFAIRAPRREEFGGDGRGVARTTTISEWVHL